MVTPKREWFPGVSYHITSRGNHRNDIFRDEADFGMYSRYFNKINNYRTIFIKGKYEVYF